MAEDLQVRSFPYFAFPLSAGLRLQFLADNIYKQLRRYKHLTPVRQTGIATLTNGLSEPGSDEPRLNFILQLYLP